MGAQKSGLKIANGLMLSTLLMAAPALAQEENGAVDLGTVRVTDSADNDYQARRITSATKTDTPLIDVPQSISVVTKKEIEDRAVSSMNDAVRYVPGVAFAQGEGNRDTPIFRGVATTSDFFLDGVRDDTEYFRDVYNIERVEVLKGPNAMVFGRGATGGLINRVSRMANWEDGYRVRLEGGSHEHFRGSFDANHVVSDVFALRMTGLYQNSGSYRDGVDYKRWGLNPTASFLLSPATTIQLGYEHFRDERVADRGVPSFAGRPVNTSRSTFFGSPAQSPTHADVNNVTLNIEHVFSEDLVLRNKTRYADYDKFYQNVFPGATNAAGTTVAIAAYNNAQRRKNLFNQTDLNWKVRTGAIAHTILAGAEFGRQETDNVRKSGTFGGLTTLSVPVASPTINNPVVFASTATDSNNHGVAEVAAFYLQDQIEFIPELQLVLGIRYDDFSVDFLDRRGAGTRTKTHDGLWSPRAGVIVKPAENVSLYASYSLSYQPRAGAQLASLSTAATNAGNPAFDPELFVNYEVGAKWDVLPDLSLSAALYLLERSNVVVPDPLVPGVGILIDGQNTAGIEFAATGHITPEWSVIAGYSHQVGKVRAAANGPYTRLAGLPEHIFSLWNRYDFLPELGAAIGIIHQSDKFASTSNLVTLPAFTRVDAAVFYKINEMFSLQLNVENLFDENYFEFAHNDNNITPAAPRSFKVSLMADL